MIAKSGPPRPPDPTSAPDGPGECQQPTGSSARGVKLAVIVTCFNYSEFVSRAVRSVQSQDCEDCELLVIDDGSTDRSWEVISDLGVRAARIANSGQRVACLHGLAKTRAPFVMFLDADDELLPGSLDTIIANLDEGVAKLQFPLRRIDRDGHIISGPVPELQDFRGRQLVEQVLHTGVYASPPTSGNVFRRDVCDVLEEAVYDNAVDGVILFSAPFMGDVVSLSEPLGLYRIHDRNDSGFGDQLNPWSLRRDLQRFVDRMEHLRRLLGSQGEASGLVSPERAYFYLERRFYLAVAEDVPITRQTLVRLLIRLWRDNHPTRMKAAMTSFFLLMRLLPNKLARRGIAYRMGAGRRSTRGLLRALF